ncbi:hypothetical protein [Microbacterium sp. NPDC087592]|uniref:hypothetical protein n=1 Tax=Microbacterium sp. NPDC087592 TaxID=3364193 RepID=UPI0037F11FA9
MIAVAQIIRDHRRVIARTLREEAGVGLSDLGDGLSWGEVKILIEEYASDPATHYGAELAGWSYPASTRELILLVATIRDEKAVKKLMPWALQTKTGPKATPDEITAAEAELEADIVFSS